MNFKSLFILSIALTTSFYANNALAVNYQIKNIGSLGGTSVTPKAMNNNGEVVGQASTAASSYDMFYYDGLMINLSEQLGLGAGLATTINNRGEIAGKASFPGSSSAEFFVYDSRGVVKLDELLPELNSAFAGQIERLSDNGVMVGEVGSSSKQAFMITPVDSGYEYKTIGIDGKDNWAIAVNSHGYAVGFARDSAGPSNDQAFLYDGNSSFEIGSLGGYSKPTDINDNGTIIGYSYTGSSTKAFVYENGVMQTLGTLGGSTTQALDINNQGIVVGWGYDASYKERAIIFADGSTIDLNSYLPENSGWFLKRAVAINERGEILGTGTLDGVKSVFVLSPVNEAPVADIGGPYSGVATESIAFDASQSVDPEGRSLSYSWNFGDGSYSTDVTPTHAFAQEGVYTVELTVMDESGLSDTVSIQVQIDNHPPVVVAGEDENVYVRSWHLLDGGQSYDPDGSIVEFAWRQVSGKPRLSGVYYGQSIWIKMPSKPEVLVFELTVTDDKGLSSSRTKTITVIR